MSTIAQQIYPLLFIVSTLIVVALSIRKFTDLPANITLLFLSQPLVSTTAPIMVFIGGILSSRMAPDPSLVTLPLGVMVAGTASGTIPAAFLAKKIGRRNASITGFFSAFIGSVIAGFAIIHQSFAVFTICAFFLGVSSAFVQQLRFAAIESVEHGGDVAKVLSILMFAGIFSAFIGPEVAMNSTLILGKQWGESFGYAGAFWGISLMTLVSMTMMMWFKNPEVVVEEHSQPARPLSAIIKQPIFIIALLAAALGFGLMSYIMTATPLSMHQVHGHSLQSTKWVIQSHIAAMYLPSLLTSWLSKRIGVRNILLIGSIMFAIVVVVAKSGHSVLHFWWALIILGIAWNFLFFSGTSLLHRSYKSHEKHKAQAINDFSIFSFQGASSLLAGWVLFNYGWNVVVYSAIPFVMVMFLISIYLLVKHQSIKTFD